MWRRKQYVKTGAYGGVITAILKIVPCPSKSGCGWFKMINEQRLNHKKSQNKYG